MAIAKLRQQLEAGSLSPLATVTRRPCWAASMTHALDVAVLSMKLSGAGVQKSDELGVVDSDHERHHAAGAWLYGSERV
jgi:hypothetical protein